jgi:uncharacterized protein YciI
MQFDRFTITLLISNPEAPELSEEEAESMQNRHMAHLADLHDQGYLLAAGPLQDPSFRGLSILNVEPDRARELKEADPAVRAGLYTISVMPWMVPAGAMNFAHARFPRSLEEARG